MNRLEKIQKKLKSDNYTFDLVIPEKRFFELSRDFQWLLNEAQVLRSALKKIQDGVGDSFYSKMGPDDIMQIIELALGEKKK